MNRMVNRDETPGDGATTPSEGPAHPQLNNLTQGPLDGLKTPMGHPVARFLQALSTLADAQTGNIQYDLNHGYPKIKFREDDHRRDALLEQLQTDMTANATTARIIWRQVLARIERSQPAEKAIVHFLAAYIFKSAMACPGGSLENEGNQAQDLWETARQINSQLDGPLADSVTHRSRGLRLQARVPMEQARQLLRFKLPKFSFEGKPQLGVQSHASLLEVWGALAESAWRDLKPAMIDQAQGVVRQTGWSVSVQPILLGPEVYNNKALREQLTRLTILTLSARPLVCGVRQTSAHQILVTCPSARAITTFKMELRDRWVSSLRPVVPQLKGIITEAAAPQMISSVPHEQARFLVRHASH